MPTPAQRLESRRQLGLSIEKTLVLFAGQIVERKGVADLLRAWSAIDSSIAPTAELLIVGDDLESHGKYREQMEQLASAMGCPARFAGFRTDMPKWLTAADIAVVPSHAEPLGNATLEAMSYGLPVIGCNVGGIPEMIVANETGLLVSPRNATELAIAIAQLLADKESRTRMGIAARKRCESMFSLAAHVDNVVQHYQAVLDSRVPSLISHRP
jgi:glycosyltransferase involved in cell wall biosynthesis